MEDQKYLENAKIVAQDPEQLDPPLEDEQDEPLEEESGDEEESGVEEDTDVEEDIDVENSQQTKRTKAPPKRIVKLLNERQELNNKVEQLERQLSEKALAQQYAKEDAYPPEVEPPSDLFDESAMKAYHIAVQKRADKVSEINIRRAVAQQTQQAKADAKDAEIIENARKHGISKESLLEGAKTLRDVGFNGAFLAEVPWGMEAFKYLVANPEEAADLGAKQSKGYSEVAAAELAMRFGGNNKQSKSVSKAPKPLETVNTNAAPKKRDPGVSAFMGTAKFSTGR